MFLVFLDDDIRQLRQMKLCAAKAGFDDDDVAVASNESELALAIKERDPSIVVVDLHLGEGKEDAGIDVIRRLHMEHSTCVIIAFTTKRPESDCVRAMHVGARDFICTRQYTSTSSKHSADPWQEVLADSLKFYKSMIESR
jgi:DNA-binding response OmpR family regulator